MGLKQREIATYLLLYKAFNNERVEYFKLVEFLELFYSRRGARRELRRLINLGLIRKINMEFEIMRLDEFIRSKIFPYIIMRLNRKLKNIDKKSKIIISNNTMKIICYNNECLKYIKQHEDKLSYLPLEVRVELAK